VSQYLTVTAPSARLAILPVSKIMSRPGIVTRYSMMLGRCSIGVYIPHMRWDAGSRPVVRRRRASCSFGAAARVRDWSVTPPCVGTLQFPTLSLAITGIDRSIAGACQAAPSPVAVSNVDTERPRETVPGPEGSERIGWTVLAMVCWMMSKPVFLR
jgi:hypothetical protein